MAWRGLWRAAEAPIGPLAWELPYAMGATLKKKKNTHIVQERNDWVLKPP